MFENWHIGTTALACTVDTAENGAQVLTVKAVPPEEISERTNTTTAEKLIDIAEQHGGAQFAKLLRAHEFLPGTKLWSHFERAMGHIIDALVTEHRLHPDFPATKVFERILTACTGVPKLFGHLAYVGMMSHRFLTMIRDLLALESELGDLALLHDIQSTSRTELAAFFNNAEEEIARAHTGGTMHDIGKTHTIFEEGTKKELDLLDTDPHALAIFSRAIAEPAWVEDIARGAVGEARIDEYLKELQTAFTDLATLRAVLARADNDPTRRAVLQFWNEAAHDRIVNGISKAEIQIINRHVPSGEMIMRELFGELPQGVSEFFMGRLGSVMRTHHFDAHRQTDLGEKAVTLFDVFDAMNRECNKADDGLDARSAALRDPRSRVIEALMSFGKQLDASAVRFLAFGCSGAFEQLNQLTFSAKYHPARAAVIENRDGLNVHAVEYVRTLEALLPQLYPLTAESRAMLVHALGDMLRREHAKQQRTDEPTAFRIFYDIVRIDEHRTSIRLRSTHDATGKELIVVRASAIRPPRLDEIRAAFGHAIRSQVGACMHAQVWIDPASAAGTKDAPAPTITTSTTYTPDTARTRQLGGGASQFAFAI